MTDAARDDEALVEMNLQIESDINPAELQKAPAQGAARKAGFREFREEAASSNEDVAGAATNHRHFINAVFRAHHQLFHVLDRFQLDAFRPTVRGPCVQQRAGGAADGLIHVGFFIHQLTITVSAGPLSNSFDDDDRNIVGLRSSHGEIMDSLEQFPL